MENFIRLTAEPRNEVGKKEAKKLRRQGKIPAVIYGEKKDSIPIAIALNDIKAILKTAKGENTVLKIQRDNIEVDAMLKEVQFDYLSDHVIHADFFRIDLNKPVIAKVPVIVKGEPLGVKLDGGIFDFITREIQVKCLATNIPNTIEVDVTGLRAGHSIKAENLPLEENIQLLSSASKVICSVSAKAKSETPGEEGGEGTSESRGE